VTPKQNKEPETIFCTENLCFIHREDHFDAAIPLRKELYLVCCLSFEEASKLAEWITEWLKKHEGGG
jgi:hypothetical protein